MYSLFLPQTAPYAGSRRPATFEWLQRSYQAEVTKIQDYFATRTMPVVNQHILVRAIMQGMGSSQYDVARYAESITTRSPYVAKHLQWTSPISAGVQQNKAFYGLPKQEYILSTDGYLNPFDPINWTSEVPALKVLTHPVRDLQMLLPDGSLQGTQEGIVVVQVDLPRLLLQYRGHEQRQALKREEGSEVNPGVAAFVASHLLPQLYPSHLEWVWLNRLMDRYYGAPRARSVKKLPFLVLDYSKQMDTIADEVLSRMEGRTHSYFQALQSIPAFYHNDMLEALQMPDIAQTRQVWWLLLTSRLRVMRFLMDVGGPQGRAANRGLIGQLTIALQRLLSGQVPQGVMTEEEKMRWKIDAEEILRLSV